MAAAVALESLDAPLIDSHCHIVFRNFDDDLEEVAQRWRDAGVGRLLHACVEPSEIPAIRALADRFPELRYSVGVHPLDTEHWTGATPAVLRQAALDDPGILAAAKGPLTEADARLMLDGITDKQYAGGADVSGGTPMACRTCDGSSEPLAHADPLDAHTPASLSSRRMASASSDSKPMFVVFQSRGAFLACTSPSVAETTVCSNRSRRAAPRAG